MEVGFPLGVDPGHAAGEEPVFFDGVIAEVGVHFADAHRGAEVAHVRARRADVDLAGAQVALHVAERAVEIDLAVLRLQDHVDAGWHVELDLESAVEAARAPTLSIAAEAAADHGLVAVDVDLGANVVGDALLFGALAPSVVAAADLAAEGDGARLAVAHLHLAGRDVDHDAADVAARHGSGERVRDFLVGGG